MSASVAAIVEQAHLTLRCCTRPPDACRPEARAPWRIGRERALRSRRERAPSTRSEPSCPQRTPGAAVLSELTHSLSSPSPSRPQNQKGFQKQDCIFVGKKRVQGKKQPLKETRYFKAVGLGIKTPRTAIEGTYVDKKCPWTGERPRSHAALPRCC